MESTVIRQKFFDFFQSKGHKIVPSAPMVVKDDPTLMFTNAGMNQFKDYFLGNKKITDTRIADTQKCLRVSGKHNDLEEVGADGYHHTMFEMLGNWSFGDYFKKEAISWAWELLTEVYKIDKSLLYATVFEGDPSENLSPDKEAAEEWKNYLSEDRIIFASKKDNFWEMGDTGPCGPCSEIHVDLRSEEDRVLVPGRGLVNAGHPEVIELWNLVFIQYNRKADNSLKLLPSKHVDTGMGFERLVRVLQGSPSNYDSDLFLPLIHFIEQASGKKYTADYSGKSRSDIAMRVVADHLRAITFGIADGQLPSNTGAGYVLRRILRRAVRYYYSQLDLREPLMHRMLPELAGIFKGNFPELDNQLDFIARVIQEEERAFLRTLESGIRRFEEIQPRDGVVAGEEAFELFDTYGFPIDLTRLMASEKGWQVDEEGFKSALEQQKSRSRSDAEKQVGDWTVIMDGESEGFVGYDKLTAEDLHVLKYRTVRTKGKDQYQLILDSTVFYPEGGGQVGDRGTLSIGGETIRVLDTLKENDLPVHIVDRIPANLDGTVTAQVNPKLRALTTNNHTATHLLHAALRQVLGDHVQQKGSLLNEDYLRFDFSHFGKMSDEEIEQVEKIVNEKIRENLPREIAKVGIEQAKASGAMMLFGEKYGEEVRMVTFGPEYSVELCGGCHVPATGRIGLFKITSESGIAAGVRRIEAITSAKAEEYVNTRLGELDQIKQLLKSPADPVSSIEQLIEENKRLSRELNELNMQKLGQVKDQIAGKAELREGYKFLAEIVLVPDGNSLKKLAADLLQALDPVVVVLGAEIEGRAQLIVTLSKNLIEEKGYDAGKTIRALAKHINGGGGGQPFVATAGGGNPAGLRAALQEAKTLF